MSETQHAAAGGHKKEGFFGELAGYVMEHKIESAVIGGGLLGVILLLRSSASASSSTNAAQAAALAQAESGVPTAAELQAQVQESQITAADDINDTQSNDQLQASLANTSASVSAATLQAQVDTTQSNNAVTENNANDATQLGIVQSNNQTSASIDALNDASEIQALQTQANAIVAATGNSAALSQAQQQAAASAAAAQSAQQQAANEAALLAQAQSAVSSLQNPNLSAGYVQDEANAGTFQAEVDQVKSLVQSL